MVTAGEIINDEMVEMDLELDFVAQEANITEQYLQRILDGEAKVNITAAQGLGEVFDVNPQFFINLQCNYDNRQEKEDNV